MTPDLPLRRAIAALMRHLLAAMLLVMVVIAIAEVIGRYGFSTSFGWADEVSVLLLCWAAWIGASLHWLQGTHIRVTTVLDMLSPPAAARLVRAMDAVVAVGAAALAWVSLGTLPVFAAMDMASLPMSLAPKFAAITAGSGLLALAALLNLVVPLPAPDGLR